MTPTPTIPFEQAQANRERMRGLARRARELHELGRIRESHEMCRLHDDLWMATYGNREAT